jgi:SAM-dependent methyltransferase
MEDQSRYDPTTYLGAAAHYRRGRPPYSRALEQTLISAVGLDGHGRLLDVGCGPGSLTVRLAGLFDEVVGLDPDAAMLEEGRGAAYEARATNITWVQARAEYLPIAAPGPYRLVTFGQSFHWTDELGVAEVVYDMLVPGGWIAMVVHTVEDRPTPPSPGAPPIPDDEMKALVERFLGSTRRMGQGLATERHHKFEDVLVQTRFGTPRSLFAPGIPDLLRDTNSVIAGYLSMSWSAPHLYGDRLNEFVSEARSLLEARSPEGLFWDWPGDTEIVVAHKPKRGP